jgi:universal stress protein A
MHYNNLLVPYDFEAHSREALKLASQLAGSFDSTVTIVHAYDPCGYQAPTGYVTYTDAQSKELAASLQAQLNEVARQLLDAGVRRVQSRLLEGPPAAEIVRLAREGHFDLIVMGTHGRTGIWHKLLGSLAHEVLTQAPCPVMTIRAHVLEEAVESANTDRSSVSERVPRLVPKSSTATRSSLG